MAFDASVIADIGGNTPDFAGSQAKALTLADLYDQNKVNKMKVKESEQNQSDMTYAKQILAGKDLSKLEDQNAAVAEITKRSPKLGMELMKGFQNQQAGKQELDLGQLKILDAKNDIIGAAVGGLKAKHDQLIAQGYSEQQVHDGMQQDVFSTLQALMQQKTPDGKPLMSEDDKKQALTGLRNGYSPQFIDGLVAKSKQAKEYVKNQLAERSETSKERHEKVTEDQETERERHNRTTEGQGDRRITNAEKSAAVKIKMAGEGKFTEDDASWLAEQYIAGDKSVMVGLGRGAQGPQNIIMVRHAIAREAKAQGMNPADLAARLAEYTGFVAEQRSLGTQQANVEMASSEAQQMIANARGASDDTAIARAHTLHWNKIEQWSDTELQDPKLASLKAATTAVINTWARAINPKGVATVADKEHGYELLNAAQDKATYDAVLDRFQQETEASLAAPASAKARLHDAFISGQTPKAAPAPGPGSLQPTPGRGAPGPGAPAALPSGPAAAPTDASAPKVINWAELPQ